jgi:hypothetical protein
MEANKVLASMSTCGYYIFLHYIIPKEFARYMTPPRMSVEVSQWLL